MSSCKRSQPEWKLPSEVGKSKLKLYNSLTRQKEFFIPQFGNKVLWYSCGPTVYDAAHMGHARSYISFDILRRVLADYFRYDVIYVMNITDIDDKIIRRARQTHLFEQYKSTCSLEQLLQDVETALIHFEDNVIPTVEDADKKKMLENMIKKTKEAVDNSKHGDVNNSEVIANLLSGSKDVLSEWLDELKGKDVKDNSIFYDLPARWEEAFYEDMDALNVLQPDAVTRVSEYIQEIILYVQKIIQNGLAYESNGSVYFDTIKFDQMPGHFYAKLVPEAFGDLKKLHEGEGDLSISNEKLSEKKSSSDFALWKSSKPGEPSWNSPWGNGRPGWHIECSVMASEILGESLDIHTGGFDLKFPHHDNELAQAEAYYDNDHWVRYFLHSGHLTISNCKMSKSLKNFITIKAALKEHTARQIRLAFLLHSWKDTLDYSPKTLDIALHYEKLIMEFILNVKDCVRDVPKFGRAAFQKWNLEERQLQALFLEKKEGVHEALCDNVDTRSALDNIHELITESNKYVKSKLASHSLCNRKLLSSIMQYITKILKIFGADFGDSSSEYRISDASGVEVNEEALMPYLRVLSDFRENVRQKAKESGAIPVLKLCDELRDDILPKHGVRLEDQSQGQKAAIKLVDPEILAREQEQKMKMEMEKKLEKERKMQELAAAKAEKDAKKKILPSELFKSMTDKYSQFDEKGIPTHDAEGKKLSESQMKKVMKLYAQQEKNYNSYLRTLATS
ncbi:cysteine--tRNA ligase, cytoplasmic-like [Uloborus diversus]|uniref:cysteine--tRNA ligase, cytoplasmic-like n=1 Tax=Uloborus diversus TaxID=327109 RepID=UPI00240A88F2|nr:cysteine--tRNA ligase, cytoplasmic-like [Uloborus diversus]